MSSWTGSRACPRGSRSTYLSPGTAWCSWRKTGTWFRPCRRSLLWRAGRWPLATSCRSVWGLSCASRGKRAWLGFGFWRRGRQTTRRSHWFPPSTRKEWMVNNIEGEGLLLWACRSESGGWWPWARFSGLAGWCLSDSCRYPRCKGSRRWGTDVESLPARLRGYSWPRGRSFSLRSPGSAGYCPCTGTCWRTWICRRSVNSLFGASSRSLDRTAAARRRLWPVSGRSARRSWADSFIAGTPRWFGAAARLCNRSVLPGHQKSDPILLLLCLLLCCSAWSDPGLLLYFSVFWWSSRFCLKNGSLIKIFIEGYRPMLRISFKETCPTMNSSWDNWFSNRLLLSVMSSSSNSMLIWLMSFLSGVSGYWIC